MSEVLVNGQAYLIGKLNARQQLHIVKRLAPVLQGLLPIWAMIQRNEVGEISVNELGMHAAAVISQTIGSMSDEASDYVLDLCLSAVKFKSPVGNWAPLRMGNNGSGQVMLDAADDLAVQMRLLWEVLYENLQNFSLEVLLPTSLQQSLTGMTGSALSN
jgi:hypothetical protein